MNSDSHGETHPRRQPLWRSYLDNRYTILFGTLAATMIAVPVSSALGRSGEVIDLFLGVGLLAAVLPISRRPVPRMLLVALFALAVLVRVGSVAYQQAVIAAISLVLWSLIAMVAAASALMYAVRGETVEREHVCAALSAYLLAGLYFGLLHWVIEELHPGSYSVPGHFTHTTSYYFSFVTLATIGFGDIVPKSDIARGLTVLEGIGGQLFLAVLVARLVAQHGKGKRSG